MTLSIRVAVAHSHVTAVYDGLLLVSNKNWPIKNDVFA